ncbi:hypothetical protein T459_09506 [Capsicum annuum]|uniref:Late embryogenesis abundant protein LEA-2 subgroup domain-containing protein n=1 Tax=Capsicum annuum TaxID=4072 RepID=A0A2G2ZZK9_CAPAN|nr:hypothetical protein T459_09506 [Capsicum annuum]
MSEEEEQQLQTNNGHAKQAGESANPIQSKELRRKKFLVTPKFRVLSTKFDHLETRNVGNASFNITMNVELAVKNANFGPYKYKNSTIYFYYNGVSIGEAFISQGKAGFKSSKKFNVIVNLSSNDMLAKDLKLRTDLSSGTLILTSKSKLDGKVKLLFVIKKKKSTEMDCTITVGLTGKVVRDIECN